MTKTLLLLINLFTQNGFPENVTNSKLVKELYKLLNFYKKGGRSLWENLYRRK